MIPSQEDFPYTIRVVSDISKHQLNEGCSAAPPPQTKK